MGAPVDVRRRRLTTAGVAAVSTAVLALGLWRPAFGEDESILVMVARWPREQFVAALQGQEAPIAPYYVIMRLWLRASTQEWWARLPSLVAMVAAVVLLAGWVERRMSRSAGLLTAAVMLCLPSISRFAQEARPYGLTVCATVACSIAWWRARTTTGRAPTLWYSASIVVLGLNQALALSVVAAQLVCSVLRDPDPVRRVRHRPLSRTVVPAVIGLVLVAPFVVLASGRGTGNLGHLKPNLHNVWAIAAAALTGEPREARVVDQIAWLVVGLAVLGLWRLRQPSHRILLGYCWLWALVPVDAMLLASPYRPTLVARYLLPTAPAWSVLAAQGCLVLATAATKVATGLLHNRHATTVLGATAATLPLVVLLAVGWPRQVLYRTASGHPFGDVRPAVALLSAPGYRDLPVVVLPSPWYAVQALVYDPTLARRLTFTDGPRMADGLMVATNSDRSAADAPTMAALVPTADPAAARGAVAAWTSAAGYSIADLATDSDWTVLRLTRTVPG
jgi:mannosyltransferase